MFIMTKKKLDDKELAMARIRQSRTTMLAKHPFFGDLAYSMQIKIDDTLNPPTAATDGDDLYYHPAFIKSLKDSEVVFVTGHEVLHAALDHVHRKGNRDPQGWNVACDIVVNQLLIDNGVGSMPPDLIYDPDLYRRGGGMVTKIYDLLPKNDKRKAMDDFKPGGKPDPARAAKMRARLQKALQVAKEAGTVSGSLEAFVEGATAVKVPWEQYLREFMSATRDDRTYARRNRRYAALDVILPARDGEKIGPIVFGIDCSGSTDDVMIAQCGAEIQSIVDDLQPDSVHVVYWDTEVKKVEVYKPGEQINVKAYGRGGTRPQCVFEYLAKENIVPDKAIIATDLEFYGDIGPEPEYPVMWAVMQGNKTNIAWGEVLVVD